MLCENELMMCKGLNEGFMFELMMCLDFSTKMIQKSYLILTKRIKVWLTLEGGRIKMQ